MGQVRKLEWNSDDMRLCVCVCVFSWYAHRIVATPCPHRRGKKVEYPIIADPNRDLAEKLGMLDPDEKNAAGLPMTCRAVFIIGTDKKLKLQILYPASTGRNFHGTLNEGIQIYIYIY